MSTDNHSIRNHSYMEDWEYPTGEDISYDSQVASIRDEYVNPSVDYVPRQTSIISYHVPNSASYSYQPQLTPSPSFSFSEVFPPWPSEVAQPSNFSVPYHVSPSFSTHPPLNTVEVTQPHYTISDQVQPQDDPSWSQIYSNVSNSYQQAPSHGMTSRNNNPRGLATTQDQQIRFQTANWTGRLRGMGITKETRYSQLLLLIHQLQPVSIVRSLLYGLENLGYARKEWVESVNDERSVEGVCVALLKSSSVHGGMGSVWLEDEAQGDDMFPGVYHSG
ncbi:hypothetical protein M231_03793 [Tremella mesenterica]|uniref:Uncharacterized protein n=1 Tax=Tremella mesenterica TaxID=5217 RepID=A0A4Q1BM95_TREME|nr:hypothetical protein M231_03793 [Tremella mesenterica]